jgi:hypothetical protein
LWTRILDQYAEAYRFHLSRVHHSLAVLAELDHRFDDAESHLRESLKLAIAGPTTTTREELDLAEHLVQHAPAPTAEVETLLEQWRGRTSLRDTSLAYRRYHAIRKGLFHRLGREDEAAACDREIARIEALHEEWRANRSRHYPAVPSVSAQEVTRAIRAVVWPLLKQEDFTHFTSRTAYRYRDGQIHVVSVLSLGAHYAVTMSATPPTFELQLGVFLEHLLPVYPFPKSIKTRGPRLIPHVAQCPIRRQLVRGVPQDRSAIGPQNYPTLWYVDEDGGNIEACVDDAAQVLAHDGLPWLGGMKPYRFVLGRLTQGGDGRNPADALPDHAFVDIRVTDKDEAITRCRRQLEA